MEEIVGYARSLSPLILALDTADLNEAVKLSRSLSSYVDVVKVGLELFCAQGPQAVKGLKEEGFEVFLDLKAIDIPNTVASSLKVIAGLEPLMVTLHTMGGQEMMRAAQIEMREYCSKAALRKPLLLGVTVLTSLDILALKKIGLLDSVESQVIRLSRLAASSGLDGLIASPLEVLHARRAFGNEGIIVVPGIRPKGVAPDDQKRIGTPGDAVRSGADFIVVGRPLRDSREPVKVAKEILKEIGHID